MEVLLKVKLEPAGVLRVLVKELLLGVVNDRFVSLEQTCCVSHVDQIAKFIVVQNIDDFDLHCALLVFVIIVYVPFGDLVRIGSLDREVASKGTSLLRQKFIIVCSKLFEHLMPGDDFRQADALKSREHVVSLILILCILPLSVAKLWIVSFVLDWTHRVLSLLEDSPVEDGLALQFLDLSVFGRWCFNTR